MGNRGVAGSDLPVARDTHPGQEAPGCDGSGCDGPVDPSPGRQEPAGSRLLYRRRNRSPTLRFRVEIRSLIRRDFRGC